MTTQIRELHIEEQTLTILERNGGYQILERDGDKIHKVNLLECSLCIPTEYQEEIDEIISDTNEIVTIEFNCPTCGKYNGGMQVVNNKKLIKTLQEVNKVTMCKECALAYKPKSLLDRIIDWLRGK